MARGTGASAGIGIGKAAILREEKLVIENTGIEDAEAEKERFKSAVEQSIADVSALADDMASRIGEKEAEILNGHLMLLQDPMLTGEIENQIDNDKVCSEFAVETVCNMYADMFASMDDELMQQRAADMRDIKTRMQKILLGVQSVDVSLLPAGTILMAEDLTHLTAGINPDNVAECSRARRAHLHSAILSRALEIPAVVAASGILSEVKDGDELILDGESGEIFVNPGSDLIAE